MRRLPCVAAAGLLVGCTPRPILPPLVRALTTRQPSLDPLPWQARATFDSAVAAGDAGRIAAVFAPNAFVISAKGDTLPARDVIPLYLDQLRHDGRSVRFMWAREGGLESCSGGAREHLLYTAQLAGSDSTTALTGHVAVFWIKDTTGAAKVAWIAFDKRAMDRRLTPLECPSRRRSRAYTYRWRVAASVLPGAGNATNRTASSLESVLRQRGWMGPDCACFGPNQTYTPLSERTALATPSLISVQAQFLTHLVAEVLTGPSVPGTTLGAQWMPNGDYAQTRLWYSGHFTAALLSYERWGFQVGAGPMVQTSQWRIRGSVVPFSTGGSPTFHDTTWSAKGALGVLVDARYTLLLTPHTFLSLRAQKRRVPDAKTLTTSTFPEATVEQGGSLVGVVWGVFW